MYPYFSFWLRRLNPRSTARLHLPKWTLTFRFWSLESLEAGKRCAVVVKFAKETAAGRVATLTGFEVFGPVGV